jgi:hypothetical protein
MVDYPQPLVTRQMKIRRILETFVRRRSAPKASRQKLHHRHSVSLSLTFAPLA